MTERPRVGDARLGDVSIREYCRCGAQLTGRVSSAQAARSLVQSFWSLHQGAGHGTATALEAARARARSGGMR